MSMAKTIVEKLNLHKYERVAVLDLPARADYLRSCRITIQSLLRVHMILYLHLYLIWIL